MSVAFAYLVLNEAPVDVADTKIFGTPKTVIERSQDKPPKSSDDLALRKTLSYDGDSSRIIFSETSRKNYF